MIERISERLLADIGHERVSIGQVIEIADHKYEIESWAFAGDTKVYYLEELPCDERTMGGQPSSAVGSSTTLGYCGADMRPLPKRQELDESFRSWVVGY